MKKYYAIILAGGSGIRFGSELPKQFVNLANKPIIIHSLEKFICFKEFLKIIICVPEQWQSFTADILVKHGLSKDSRIRIITGGNDRNDSINKGIEDIQTYEANLENIIIVSHDAVRPFISFEIIQNNLYAAIDNPVVNTVVPATDTIVESLDGKYIHNVPKRSNLYYGQTPQTFSADLFLKYINNKDGIALSDAVGLFTQNKHTAKIVDGDYANIKITTKFDILLAEALIKNSAKKA